MQGPFCVHTARTLWVISILSFRGVDCLRARVLPTATDEPRIPPRVEPLEGPNVSRVVVRYSSRKACLAGRKKKGRSGPAGRVRRFRSPSRNPSWRGARSAMSLDVGPTLTQPLERVGPSSRLGWLIFIREKDLLTTASWRVA